MADTMSQTPRQPVSSDASSKMEPETERRGKYHVTFKAMPPAGILGKLGPFLNTDVTNPRELYSILSESKQGALLGSLTVKPPSTSRLPPLQTSSEGASGWSLANQTQHSSQPDLLRCYGYPAQLSAANADNTFSVRRSSSLQDVSTLHQEAGNTKLRPILRRTALKLQGEGLSGRGGAEVKFKDAPLSPIEGASGQSSDRGTLSFQNGIQGHGYEGEGRNTNVRGEGEWSLGNSRRYLYPQRQRRAEKDLFPRGQTYQVKKPTTPTFESFPEVYWELRSPTVQEPRDLKDDMIDRSMYRLQQMSALRLRAIKREAVPNRLDQYRKWQQQQQQFQQQQDSTHAVQCSAEATQLSGKQQRLLLPIRNHMLGIKAVSISATNHSPTKPRHTNHNNNNGNGDRTEDAANEQVADDELQRRNKMAAAARAAIDEGCGEVKDGRKVKATVVNLCIEPDGNATSNVHNSICKVVLGPRPQSDRARALDDEDQGPSLPAPPDCVSNGSHSATVGYACIPSSPKGGDSAVMDGSAVADGVNGGGSGGKLLLTKFTKLEVFSEKRHDLVPFSDPGQGHNVVPVKMGDKNRPYMPQNRPPLYKLDTRHCLSCAGSGKGHGNRGGHQSREESATTVPPRSPDQRSGVHSLSFRFHNGEVIVSRQGKRPTVPLPDSCDFTRSRGNND